MNYWFLYNLSDGSIHGAPYLGNADEWTNIPRGCGVLGAIPADTASLQVIDAFNNPTHYTVQNGQLTAVANIAQLQLTQAQATKIAQITAGYNQELRTQFVSSANGTATTYAYGQDQQTKYMKLLMLMNTSMITYPYTVYDINSNAVPLTQAQLQQLYKDIDTFESNLEGQMHTLINQVNACTTVAQVNALTISFN